MRRPSPRPTPALAGALLLCLTATAAVAETAAVRITGSGYTMPRFLEPWAAMFEEETGTTVSIAGTGTSTGPPALLRGDADIAAMSRPMNDAELAAFVARRGGEPVAIPVAADALAVFVNGGNPLERLTLLQLDAIFSAERRCGPEEAISRWGEIGLDGAWRERRLTLYGRRPGSGTGALFRELALCGGPYRADLRINPGGASAALAIAEEPYGIGFGGRTDGVEGMKMVAIATAEGEPYKLPTRADDVYSGAYPLGRQLYFYVLGSGHELAAPVREFLVFALSEPAQDVVEQAGFMRIPPDMAATVLATRVPGAP